MRWKGRRQSDNIEDRRGFGRRALVGGGIGLLIMVLLITFLGGDPRPVMQQAQRGPAQAGAEAGAPAKLSERDIQRGQFVSIVLADSEDVWNGLFQQSGLKYQEPKLTLFTEQVQSGCGIASAAAGPFYCPADRKVYLDTAFFDQLARQLDAPGDFAQAYVIAHEVGHHVQNLLGKTSELDQLRGRVPQAEYNKYSVMLELQADFYAGVMFHHAQRQKDIIEPGDIEEGLRLPQRLATIRYRSAAQGTRQETFTHGTSEQRVRWFMKGLETGDPAQGDTFKAGQL